MNSTESNPETGQEVRDFVRRLLCGICVIATFFSACFAAHGVMMTGQFLSDEIPAGRIEAISGHTKIGLRIRLYTGREAVFPSQVLYQQKKPIELVVGDRVEKHRDSLVYTVNGNAITNLDWMLRNWLLPTRLLVPFGAYFIAGVIYVWSYGRTPLGDCIWSGADSKRPKRPRTRAGMIVVVLLAWLGICGLVTTAFGCMGGCLTGVGRALFG